MKIIGAAIVAVGLFASTPVLAATAEDHTVVSVVRPAGEGREQVSLQVSTAGIDLSTARGADRLRNRVTRAISAACNPGDRLNADMSPDFQCRREMATYAEPALRSATRGAFALN